MKLQLGTASRNRLFGKAIVRNYAVIKSFMEGFGAAMPTSDECDAILVGLTDDKDPDYFEKVDNTDGFFQVLAGCSYSGDDLKLKKDVYARFVMAIEACPMSSEHKKAALEYARQHEII